MAKYPRRITNGSMTLITKTAAGKNAFGETTYTETEATDDVVLQYVDRLENPGAGNIRYRALLAITDPQYLTPRVNDEATVNGVRYRVTRVEPNYWKGAHFLDRVELEEV